MSEQEAFESWFNKYTTGQEYYFHGYTDKSLELCWQASADNEQKRVIGIIENYQVPVGNSPAGEMACEWTMAALKDIKDEILNRGSE